jgi:hypothetical protein
MCYNCGCELPDEDHGIAANITNATFERAAEALKQSDQDARANTLKLLGLVDLSSGAA